MATDERFDELISTWLQETAPAQIPTRVLEEAALRTRTSRQQVRWRGLPRSIDVSRSMLALGATAAIVLAAIVALSPRVAQPDVGELPTTPDAWSLVPIDSPWATAQVDALVAGPRGLLAILGEGGSSAMQLSVSRDGRNWALVPNEQFPSDAILLPPSGGLRLPAVGTTHGFLFIADGNDVWASEDGHTWQRLADRARDRDLRAGSVLAVAVGGPGLIAVGSDNKAWYSEDGSDWTLAEVPSPPTESFEARGLPPPTVSMQGVAVRGETFVAWGIARSSPNSDAGMQETVLWTSGDGRTWANVPDQQDLEPVQSVAAGPGGFVATDMNVIGDARAIRFSADGRSWETVDVFESRLPSHDEGLVSSVAAARSGYVAVGGDGKCAMEPCPGAVATIWTSPDGRTWSRLPSDDRFEVADPQNSANHSGAWATAAAAWDSRFVVAGAYDASPAIWISSPPDTTEAPFLDQTPSPSTDAPSQAPQPQPSEHVAQPSEAVARTATAQPSVDPGTFEPTAGRITCGNRYGSWSFPAASPGSSRVLGCSMDGTRVLIQKGNENLFVLDPDGSETQVTEQLTGFAEIPGSARPTGATISPDGSRVVFAGLTKPWQGNSCHDGALFAVGADGGPAELLWTSQVRQNGIVRDPSFSPDGTRIAFADGYCDSSHSVWVMDADGSDPHQIVFSDIGPLGATHVHGLAWSAAGDQIALQVDEGTYVFATDGSGLANGSASEFCWPGREC